MAGKNHSHVHSLWDELARFQQWLLCSTRAIRATGFSRGLTAGLVPWLTVVPGFTFPMNLTVPELSQSPFVIPSEGILSTWSRLWLLPAELSSQPGFLQDKGCRIAPCNLVFLSNYGETERNTQAGFALDRLWVSHKPLRPNKCNGWRMKQESWQIIKQLGLFW